MITCPNCGTQNEPGSRFCAECGADLRVQQAAPEPSAATPPLYSAPSIPPQYDLGTQPGNAPSWASGSATDAPPPPERKRRTWLWIVIGVLGTCLLLCCAFAVYASTESGERFINNLGTRVADYQTETAD